MNQSHPVGTQYSGLPDFNSPQMGDSKQWLFFSFFFFFYTNKNIHCKKGKLQTQTMNSPGERPPSLPKIQDTIDLRR